MPDRYKMTDLIKIFESYPDIATVYLFGSFLLDKKNARDVDLAVLFKKPPESRVDLYMSLYADVSKSLAPLEPDLLFLCWAALPVCFEAVSVGKVIYCADDEIRTDFEYLTSGRYMDFSYHLNRARLELFETIKEEGALV